MVPRESKDEKGKSEEQKRVESFFMVKQENVVESVSSVSTRWLADGGSSCHITHQLDLVTDYVAFDKPVDRRWGIFALGQVILNLCLIKDMKERYTK